MIIDAGLAAEGSGSLVKQNGRPRWRSTASANWSYDQWSSGVFLNYISDIVDTSTRADSDTAQPDKPLPVDEYMTVNASVITDSTRASPTVPRLRLGVKNLFDEETPLADEQMGYFGSLHSNRGRYFYVDFCSPSEHFEHARWRLRAPMLMAIFSASVCGWLVRVGSCHRARKKPGCSVAPRNSLGEQPAFPRTLESSAKTASWNSQSLYL